MLIVLLALQINGLILGQTSPFATANSGEEFQDN
jgi:hypothetical protein